MIEIAVTKRGLNKDIIKYFAMFTMLLNHNAQVALVEDTLLYHGFLDIGYFTAITMCFFLVEGYGYTKSKRNYARRLFLFAILSEIPYCITFAGDRTIRFVGLNMLFSLLNCFLLIHLKEEVQSKLLRMLGILGAFLVSFICDWGFFAPLFTLLFLWARGSKRKLCIAYLIAILSFGASEFLMQCMEYSLGTTFLYTLGQVSGIVLSGICITSLYNGQRMKQAMNFSKWFFYAFYPGHLIILACIKLFCLK